VILGAVDTQTDITLAELTAMLKREPGASFAISTVHRFLTYHWITLRAKDKTV
jgi:hypothetical protein